MVLSLSPAAARHLVVALGEHLARCRRDALVPPGELLALFEAAEAESRRATGDDARHPGPEVATPAGDAHDQYQLLAVGTAARRLGVSARTVGRRVAAGELTAVGSGRGRRITRRSVEAYERGSA